MTECEFCGARVSGGSAFTCTYCGGTFCPSHRLPFNHACPLIEDWKNAKPAKIRKVRMTGKKSFVAVDQKTVIAGGVILLFVVMLLVWMISR